MDASWPPGTFTPPPMPWSPPGGTAPLWSRPSGRYTVVIADDGLDPLGRAVANALVSREPRVILCPMGALTEYLV